MKTMYWVLTLLLGVMGSVAAAQTLPTAPGPPNASAPGGIAIGETTLAILAAVAVLVVAVIALVKIFARRQEDAEFALEAHVAEAFRREGDFVARSVVATAHVPFWSGAPTVALTGQVDGPHLRDLARRLAEQAATRVRPDVRIEDRLTEAPAPAARVA